MVYSPRWYQTESAKAMFDAVKDDPKSNPISVMPTGSGKTYTICEFINLYLTHKPRGDVLVLSHVKEILEQNHNSISEFFEGIEIGLYSSGLDSKTIKKITVAGIQSVHKKPELFLDTTLIIIDECHLVSYDDKSMYRKFLKEMEANVAGLTATPFRTTTGLIYEGEKCLFNNACYDLSSFQNYNRLVDEGFLSPLVNKLTHLKLRAEDEKVRTTGGDWNSKDLSVAFDRKDITDAAIQEVITFGKIYKLWLLFAIDIEHAEHIAATLTSRGIKTACVHSKMEADRDRVIAEIKAGAYRAVVNVDVLTTGFDAPNVDLIALLRPTKSPGLHVQMLGRGARPVFADGFDLSSVEGRLAAMEAGPKQRCLVLDFVGNCKRLGPINKPNVKDKKEKGPGGKQIMKECPECLVLHFPITKECDVCGHKFVFREKLKTTSYSSEVMQEKVQQWLDVHSVSYSIHQKKGSPSSLRVTYKTGISGFSEWICYDHKGYAKHRANNWVKFRLPPTEKMPDDLNSLYRIAKILKKPKRIFVSNSKKFPEIKKFEF